MIKESLPQRNTEFSCCSLKDNLPFTYTYTNAIFYFTCLHWIHYTKAHMYVLHYSNSKMNLILFPLALFYTIFILDFAVFFLSYSDELTWAGHLYVHAFMWPELCKRLLSSVYVCWKQRDFLYFNHFDHKTSTIKIKNDEIYYSPIIRVMFFLFSWE